MTYTMPQVTYNISTVNLKFNKTTELTVNSAGGVSYYYKIIINLIPENCNLGQFDARVTSSDVSWDIDQGKLLCRATNLKQGVQHSCEFFINPENFPAPGEYRIGLYAQNELNGAWDVTYLFVTLTEQSGTEQFILADNTPFEVLTTRNTQD